MPHLSRLTAVLAVALVAVSAAQAQQVRGATTTTPSASARSAQAAPNPAGLRPLFPAGLNSGSGASQSGDPIARTTAPPTTGTTTAATTTMTNGGRAITTTTNTDGTTTQTTATTGGNTGITPELLNSNSAFLGAAAATATMGAGGFVAGPSQFVPGGSSGFSAVDIARSFINADGNRDGELSRSEARRLSLATQTFEEMDRNFDGVISRGEYEDGLR